MADPQILRDLVRYDPTVGMSKTDQFVSGVGSGVMRIGDMFVSRPLGFVSQEEMDEQARLDEALLATRYGNIGEYSTTKPIISSESRKERRSLKRASSTLPSGIRRRNTYAIGTTTQAMKTAAARGRTRPGPLRPLFGLLGGLLERLRVPARRECPIVDCVEDRGDAHHDRLGRRPTPR